jgi:hypothetical protein
LNVGADANNSSKNSLALFYSAEGKLQGEKLVSVAAGSKTVGFLNTKRTGFGRGNIATLLSYMKWHILRSFYV